MLFLPSLQLGLLSSLELGLELSEEFTSEAPPPSPKISDFEGGGASLGPV